VALWIETSSVIPICLEQERLEMASAYYWWAEECLPGVSEYYLHLPVEMASAFTVRSLNRYDHGHIADAESDWETAKSFLRQYTFESIGTLVEKLARNHRDAQQHILALELALHPEQSVVRIYLAQSYNAVAQGQAALAVISPLIAAMPEDTRVWQQYGQALLNMRRFAEAETALKEAVRLAPDDLHAANRLGVLYKVSGKHASAKRAFRRALELDKAGRAYWVWEHLGDVLVAEGSHDEAAEMYIVALDLAPPAHQERIRAKLPKPVPIEGRMPWPNT